MTRDERIAQRDAAVAEYWRKHREAVDNPVQQPRTPKEQAERLIKHFKADAVLPPAPDDEDDDFDNDNWDEDRKE